MERDELQRTMEAHRFWLRNDRRGKRADLTLTTLRQQDLKEAELSRAKLTGAQLIRCDLSGARLIDADLFAANLIGTIFRRAKCTGADFRGAALAGADFTEASMAGADFREGALMVNIGGAVGPAEHRIEPGAGAGAKMARANLEGAKLHRSVIRHTDLSGAILRNADLSHANLSGTILKDADLRGANLNGCNLSRALLNRAAVDGANLEHAILRDTNVFGVAFDKASCDGVDFSEAIAVDDSKAAAVRISQEIASHERWVETSGAEGTRADFAESDLSGLSFTGRNLTGAVFARTRLRSTNFNEAILNLTDFSGADLTAAQMRRADAKGADFSEALLRRTDLRDADLGVQVATLPDGSTREWPVRFILSIMDETNMAGARSSRVIAEGIDLAGVIGDSAILAVLGAKAKG